MDPNPDSLLTTSEAAELLAVHPSTVKRWFDEAGVPVHKTPGGHRRILLEDVLGQARARGQSTFLSAFVPDQDRVWSALRSGLDRGEFTDLLDLFTSWLAEGRPKPIGDLLLHLGDHPRLPFSSFADRVVGPWMDRVGRSWENGGLHVAEERAASRQVVEALLALRAGHASGSSEAPAPEAVVGSMEGDQHYVGALLVRVLLERRGWSVEYLGPDVPLEEFGRVQRTRGAALVAVSFAPPMSSPDVSRLVRRLAADYDPATPYALAVGGAGAAQSRLRSDRLPFRDVRVFARLGSFERWSALGEPAAGSP